MANYIDIHFNKNIRPVTDYPKKLCRYLFQRYEIKQGMTLLDAGCGRGDFMIEFQKLGLETIGLDLVRSNLNNLEIKINKVNFETDRFPLPDNSVDIVFSKSVVEHLRNTENYLKEAYRVLRPGGKIILMTPDWQSQRYVFYYDYTHIRPYISPGIENMLTIFDFKETRAELFYQLPLVWRMPILKIFLKPLRLIWPVKKINKNNFFRWSRELMILGMGVK
jgi:SAM-dependent methyltransferase